MSLAKTVEAKTVERRELERLRYFEGQRLSSRDLNDQLAREAELRWWHNRALHDAYGVFRGLGLYEPGDASALPPEVLAVIKAEIPNARFDQVGVMEGGAYDAFGRELEIREPRIVSPPAAGSSDFWVLVLRHRSDPASPCRRGFNPTEVELRWIAKRRWTPQSGVPLAAGSYLGLPVFVWVAYPSLPRVRPLARPVLGQGATIPGSTAWRSWEIFSGLGTASGVEVGIDTSAAGFTDVPCYFAWLQGELPILSGQGTPPWVLGRVLEATPESFTFSLWVRSSSTVPSAIGTSFDITAEARRRLSVCWLGIEMRSRVDDESQEMEHGYF